MVKKFKIWVASKWPDKAPTSWVNLAFDDYWSRQGIDAEERRKEMLEKIMNAFKEK